MKTIAATIVLAFSVSQARSGELILPYSAFGPQVAAYELIGMEWWQWDSQGGDTQREYPIKVVVFWDQSREDTAESYPVVREKQQDFRYVEYTKAVEYLERIITEFKEAKLDSTPMQKALIQLKEQKKANKSEMATPRKPSD